MDKHIKIGQIGENLACQYLLDNRYKIIERNYRETWGEIDIICKDKSGALVFVEVKALKLFHATPMSIYRPSTNINMKQSNKCFTPNQTQNERLMPENNLSNSKLEKIKRTSYIYANNHQELVDDNKGWRIDLIAVEINCLNPENADQKELIKHSVIRHYKNI